MEDDFSKLSAMYLPRSFGDKSSKRTAPEATVDNSDDASDVEGKSGVEEIYEEPVKSNITLPISHEAKLEQHTKTVSCVEVESSGARMVTGGYDFNVGYYDFGGMDSSLQPFRYVNPDRSYKIKSLRFSRCSQWLLCASSSNTPVLMDRNGSKVRTYAEGDQYLRDLKNTNGHVAALTSCSWSPISADHFLTSSEDGTVRIWNIGYRKRQDHVLVVKSKRAGAGRSAVTHARYSNDGSMIITGSSDGSLKLYSSKGPWNFPNSEILNSHNSGSEITCLAIDSSTGNLVCSRATDGTAKLWDLRSWKTPIASATDLPNFCSETACVFSPDDSLIVTGTSAKKGEEWGRLVFLNPSRDLAIEHSIDNLTKSSVVGLAWPSSINQIVTGNGDGTASILYDPQLSKKGVITAMSKAPKKVRDNAVISDLIVGRIITPHSLPLFRDTEGRSLKRSRLKARKDPIQSHLPTRPIDGPGQGGRLGTGLTQSIMKEMLPSNLASTRDEDPREALLRYAEKAASDPRFITPAYQATQPQAVLDEGLLKKEADLEMKKKADKEALELLKKQ